MKKIVVILPVNNQTILCQKDLEPYQSQTYHYELNYIDTPLQELNTVADAVAILPLVLNQVKVVNENGAAAVIVYAFGDVCIKESRSLVSIPVMGLGKSAIHMASLLCRHRFTVIPGMLNHNNFIEDMVFEEGLMRKFIPASSAVDVAPMDIRRDNNILDKLVDVACLEYTNHGIDCFTLGCGSFIGLAKSLQQKLTKKLQTAITVVDPVDVAFAVMRSLI